MVYIVFQQVYFETNDVLEVFADRESAEAYVEDVLIAQHNRFAYNPNPILFAKSVEVEYTTWKRDDLEYRVETWEVKANPELAAKLEQDSPVK